MLPSVPFPTYRCLSGVTSLGFAPAKRYYSRSDQPCVLSFRVGDIVWARFNGKWALGVVVSNRDLLQCQSETRAVPTCTILTRGGSTDQPTLVALSPLFGSLKPANEYTAALLHAEGVLPLNGTNHADVLDLQLKAHAWIEQRVRKNRLRGVVS